MRPLLVVSIVAAVVLVAAITYLSSPGEPDEDGFLYAVYTDAESNLNVIDVYESHVEDGKTTPLVQRYRTSDSEGGINPEWSFDRKTGIGPFNTFYAAINLSEDSPAYDADDSAERRLSTSVGAVGYILNPYDLTRTLAGHAFDPGLYNVMLVIPTVYWVSEKVTAEETVGNLVKGKEYNVLYLSSSDSYAPAGHERIVGMKAYAHSASLVPGKADFDSAVYPYLGIGVYESYVTTDADAAGAGKLVSQSGKVPTSGYNVDQFKETADALVPVSGGGLKSDYQQWNHYQWTLYKMMCYTVMGSKNSQVMVGVGYTEGNDSPAVTGSTDTLGFAGIAAVTKSSSGVSSSEAGRTSAKLFIENGWGSLNVFVGDAFVIGTSSDSMMLYAGNYLGGEKLLEKRDQPPAGQPWADIFITGTAHRVIAGASVESATWDVPILANANSAAYGDAAYPGDIVNGAESGVLSITAGGRWNNTHYAGVAFACAGYDIALANEYRGARLAYLMSDAAVS